MSKLGRIHNTSDVKVGDKTNKGIVDEIYSNTDILVDGMYYDLTKHKIIKL